MTSEGFDYLRLYREANYRLELVTQLVIEMKIAQDGQFSLEWLDFELDRIKANNAKAQEWGDRQDPRCKFLEKHSFACDVRKSRHNRQSHEFV